MSIASIINLITVGLELVNYFIDLSNDDYKKVPLPKNTRSKIAMLRAETRAKEKYK